MTGTSDDGSLAPAPPTTAQQPTVGPDTHAITHSAEFTHGATAGR
ncbi:hypothetical protein ACWEDZ_02075 [Streptomyces sp. NPDC005047]